MHWEPKEKAKFPGLQTSWEAGKYIKDWTPKGWSNIQIIAKHLSYKDSPRFTQLTQGWASLLPGQRDSENSHKQHAESDQRDPEESLRRLCPGGRHGREPARHPIQVPTHTPRCMWPRGTQALAPAGPVQVYTCLSHHSPSGALLAGSLCPAVLSVGFLWSFKATVKVSGPGI